MMKLFLFSAFFTLTLLIPAEYAQAYIGPGAGFAIVSSFFVFFVTIVLAILTIFFWPVRFIIKGIGKKRRSITRDGIQRVIIIGLDGMDPCLAAEYMKEGKLPNLSRIRESGAFKKLKTTLPPISPVAWSTFTTGVDPSQHNIFDFLNRDLRTYLPELSSTKIEKPARSISIGKYSIPLGKPVIRLLRRGKPFWSILGEYGIFSSIIRVPITFPPERHDGVLLSGMCVPDLKGTQGTFTFYTSHENSNGKWTGGVRVPVRVEGNKIKTYIPGPNNYLLKNNDETRSPLEITLNGNYEAELKISRGKFVLKTGNYSEWIKLTFKIAPGIKVKGISRFFLKRINPCFEMYMTPINIDPEKPLFPISYPMSYSIYLAKMIGSYATLGLAEDTWALNERVIDEDVFLAQAYKHHQEREEMFFNTLDKTRRGLCVSVFDTTDRIQHMFMRFMSDPAQGKDREKYRHVIEELYAKMDRLVGRVMEKTGKKDVLMVISDHGFKAFRRGVNLNTWLYKNGYLSLKEKKRTVGEWLQDIDWEKTRAYTFGMSGIYINEKGRESKGIVSPREKEELKMELIAKLQGLKDEERGEISIKEVYNIKESYNGPYLENGPDIIIGYNEGYRASWGAAVGRVDEEIFEDNNKSWSGDHCMDPSLVPGVFFCNRDIHADDPGIIDIAPTVLELFGVKIPSYMKGKSLIMSKKFY